MPTTLGVGVALTGAARGNQALALLLTVGTNLLGIVTTPFWLHPSASCVCVCVCLCVCVCRLTTHTR